MVYDGEFQIMSFNLVEAGSSSLEYQFLSQNVPTKPTMCRLILTSLWPKIFWELWPCSVIIGREKVFLPTNTINSS